VKVPRLDGQLLFTLHSLQMGCPAALDVAACWSAEPAPSSGQGAIYMRFAAASLQLWRASACKERGMKRVHEDIWAEISRIE
jgi:hypothetical protein